MRFVIFFLIAGFTTVYGQMNNFRAYSIEDGLPQSTVYSMIQDNRGYFWLGTDGGGLCRFDGIEFHVFNKKNGLPGNVIRSLFEDSKGNIWIGSDEGLAFYNGYSFITIDSLSGEGSGTILDIGQDAEGNIWAASDNGLHKLSPDNNTFNITTYTTSDGLETNFIFSLFFNDDGKLWLALYGGIHMVDISGGKFDVEKLSRDDGLPGNIYTCIEKDLSGMLWFGSYDEGIVILNPVRKDNGYSLKAIKNELPDITVWDLLTDHIGNIWICTDKGGICKFNGTSFQRFSEEEGLQNNQILCALEDEEHNLWFGSMGSGLIRHLGEHFSHYSARNGLSGEQISHIIRDRNGNFWLSSLGGGLMKADFSGVRPAIETFDIKNGLPDINLNSLYEDSDGNIWIATQNGLSVLEGKSFINVSENDGLVDNRVNCILIDSQGIIWIGTGAGLSIFSEGEYLNITEESQYGISNDKIQTIIEGSDGSVWVGTLGGLIRFSKGQMTQYDEAEGLNDKSIHALVEDEAGNIWIGTFGGGLYVLDIKTTDSICIKPVAGEEILSSPNIYSLTFMSAGQLIAGTDKGFDRLWVSDDFKVEKLKNYNRSDGFTGVENKLNAIYRDEDGNIWFGTVKGLTKYSPSKEKTNDSPPRVYLTGIDLFFEKVDWSLKADSVTPWFGVPDQLELPYSSNHLTFRYSAISMTNPSKINFRYMLEGLETEWSPVRNENEVVYSGLAPGDYIFKVIAVNENGLWTENPCEFHFTIKPPFWQTWWFIILVILAGILGFWIFIKVRERKLKHEKAILEQKVEERTREIAEKNRKLEKANEEIMQQKDVIEEKNKDIMDSIRYAKRIQEALLPPSDYLNQFLKNSFVLYKPKDIVSGDFYWMHHTKNKILFAAIDCTGHGVPGAFMSIVGHNGLNQAVIEHGRISPAEVLDLLNQIVSQTLTQKKTDMGIRDGMDMVLCSLDYEKMTVEFAGANNPLYLIRNNELSEFKGDKHPIGAYMDEDLRLFTNQVIDVKEGDVIYIFSDGYADQFGGESGKKFKYRNFKNLLLAHHREPMEDQRKILDTVIEEWRGTIEQIDDILVIGVRI